MSFEDQAKAVSSVTTQLQSMAATASAIPANVQSILDLLTRGGNVIEQQVAQSLQAYIDIFKALQGPNVSARDRATLGPELDKLKQQIHGASDEGQRVDFGVLDRYLRDSSGSSGAHDIQSVATAVAGESTGRIVGVFDEFRRQLFAQLQTMSHGAPGIAGGPSRSTSGTQTTQRGSGTIKTPSDLSTMIARGIFQ